MEADCNPCSRLKCPYDTYQRTVYLIQHSIGVQSIQSMVVQLSAAVNETTSQIEAESVPVQMDSKLVRHLLSQQSCCLRSQHLDHDLRNVQWQE